MNGSWARFKHWLLGPDFAQADPLPPWFYQNIDYSKCVIAGSHALHQLTGDQTWAPRDIDVLCAVRDEAEFQQMVKAFERKSGMKPVAESTTGSLYDWNFRKRVIDARLYRVGNKPVSLIGMKSTETAPTAAELVESTCDLPTVVSFTVDRKGKKQFAVPERAREALFNRRIHYRDSGSEERLQRYQQRGYTFDWRTTRREA